MATGPKTRATSPSSRLIPVTNLDPDNFTPFGQVIQNPATHQESPRLQSTVANQGSATKWLEVTDMRSWYERSGSRKVGRVSVNMFVCKPRELRERVEDRRKVFEVKVLERHPFTPQTFVPMGLSREDKGTCYLVIVAPTLPIRSWNQQEGRQAPYPTEKPRTKRSLKEMLLGARPNPFTNDYSPSTTPSANSGSSTHQPKGPGPPDLSNIKAFIARGDQAVTYGPGTWHAPMVVLGEKPIEFVVVQYANGVASEDCQEVDIKVEDGGGGLAVDLGGNASGGEHSPKAKL